MLRAHKQRLGEPVLPEDYHASAWEKLAEQNARDAWRWWFKVKAPQWWRDAYQRRKAVCAGKPWLVTECRTERFRVRYRADTEFRLKQILRCYQRKAKRGRYGEGLREAIKNGRSQYAPTEACGYTLADLRLHLEKQFTRGMNWDRFNAAEIHIDHIVPLSAFDLSKSEEFKAAWALTNLRPLWAKQNLRKADRRDFLL
jgi:hypothetical protein